MDFLAVIGVIALVITPIVEALKQGLNKWGWWQGRTESEQSFMLQVLAALIGIGAAAVQQSNAFALVPAFASAPHVAGIIATGIAASLPSSWLHLFAAWLGLKVNAIAARISGAPFQGQAAAVASSREARKTYAPFM